MCVQTEAGALELLLEAQTIRGAAVYYKLGGILTLELNEVKKQKEHKTSPKSSWKTLADQIIISKKNYYFKYSIRHKTNL